MCSFSNLSLCQEKNMTHEALPSVPLMLLSHFDIFCDQLLNSGTAMFFESCNVFVCYTENYTKFKKAAIYMYSLPDIQCTHLITHLFDVVAKIQHVIVCFFVLFSCYCILSTKKIFALNQVYNNFELINMLVLIGDDLFL